MNMRYRMTDEEIAELKEACRPVPYMVFGGMEPRSPRDNAMDVWNKVSARVGCKCDTIAPANTGDDRDFEAEPN